MSFKTALLQDKPLVGLWLSMTSSYSAEICATAGFDWLLIDNEHAPNDLTSTLQQLQAVAPFRAHPVVRVPSDDPVGIKRMLDIGAKALLVPMIDTPEQAAALVAATRYPPQGIRGVGAAVARASQWGLQRDYVHGANDDICVIAQVETRTALENLPALCQVDGIDGLFIGPADLAASLGHLGNPNHPDVQAAIEQAIRTIVASGKAAGTLTGDRALARRYLELGARFVAVGIEVTLMAQATRALATEFGLSNHTISTNSAY